MTTLRKQNFVDQHRGSGVELNSLKQDSAATTALTQAGVSVSALEQADKNRDGRLTGKEELAAVFDAFDAGRTGTVTTALPSGAATATGNALQAMLAHRSVNTAAPGLAQLSGTVGRGGQNKTEDVKKVQQRLADLGFDIDVDGQWGPQSQRNLDLFDGILHGREHQASGARVDVMLTLHKALLSADAPRWVEMPLRGRGFKNADADNHDYGAHITRNAIVAAGKHYADHYLASHPNAAVIATNDASLPRGGDTPDHASHEVGLDLDVRLPRTDGESGGVTVTSGGYDKNAARAMIEAFARQDEVERVLIGDRNLLAEFQARGESWALKVRDGGRQHRDHLHVDVKRPRLS